MKTGKTMLLGLCAATSLLTLSIPMSASAGVNIYFTAPPPPRHIEVLPAPRHGYIWIGGFWDFQRNHHVWQSGHWERERRGYYYAPSVWVERNHRWELQRGEWRHGEQHATNGRYAQSRYGQGHDQDHDGVANRYDRDRDGDGARNRHDAAPNNPHRR